MLISKPPIALITGASRGLGETYARYLAQQGYCLLLVARDISRLEDLGKTLMSRHQTVVHSTSLDLGQPDSGARLRDFCQEYCEAPDLLINNAGFGLYGPFYTHALVDVRKMLQLHIQTIVETIHFFLPPMIARQSGAIINVASLAGLISLPYMAEYAATKAFLVSFSEALAEELRPLGITIQVCCPGQTQTAFHATAGFRPKGIGRIQTPEEVVSRSLQALESAYPMLTIGWQGFFASILAKFLPRRFLARQALSRTRPPG